MGPSSCSSSQSSLSTQSALGHQKSSASPERGLRRQNLHNWDFKKAFFFYIQNLRAQPIPPRSIFLFQKITRFSCILKFSKNLCISLTLMNFSEANYYLEFVCTAVLWICCNHLIVLIVYSNVNNYCINSFLGIKNKRAKRKWPRSQRNIPSRGRNTTASIMTASTSNNSFCGPGIVPRAASNNLIL